MNAIHLIDVRFAASNLAFAVHARLEAWTKRQADENEREIAQRFAEVIGAMETLSGPDDLSTYLVVDEDGTFREAQRGQTRETVVRDIATGEYEAEQVLRLRGPICEDVTVAIAEEVLDAVRLQRFGNSTFVPSLVVEHYPDETEDLRLSWMSPDEIRAERDEANADYAYEAMRDRQMEAAE